MLPVQRALISVYDKRGLDQLAPELCALGVTLVSTGGTQKFLEQVGVPVEPVAETTGFPEILGGRVKTLHPRIFGGILADRAQPKHLAQLAQHAIAPIDLVVANLYPFAATVAAGADPRTAIEMIDIGGPAMIRAAAKNWAGVVVVIDPDDYPRLVAALRAGNGCVPQALRVDLAAKAFRHTQGYDQAIAAWLAEQVADATGPPRDLAAHTSCNDFPPQLMLELVREESLRYGENPHQAGALYRQADGPGVLGGYLQLQGKELSFNNLLDADAARRMVALYAVPAAVIVKHNNPCGIGCGEQLRQAYERAFASDPESAFGSVIACNREVDAMSAEALQDLFIEVLVAPGFTPEALLLLASKKNLRLLRCPLPAAAPRADAPRELRAIDGGFLAQTPDAQPDAPATWSCPTRRQPSAEEQRALAFAWTAVRGVKSNAIVVAHAEQTVGIGAGQMSRVDACRLAIAKARVPLRGAVAASDAFFPFRDGLDVLAAAGVSAVIQPGGSKRDPEVLAAANEHGMAMLLTGVRHFRH